MNEAAFETPWGWLQIAASEKGITAIRFGAVAGDTPSIARPILENQRAAALIVDARRQVLEYFAGFRRDFSFPVDLSEGTTFQRKVWQAIIRIPYGRVRSYRWVAARVGGTQYARAVGMALGANPVPLAVPCHRVIAHDGSLGGFSCGLPLKRRLLKLEGTLDQLG